MDLLYLKKEDSVATIYLNRPDKKNAMNREMWKRLLQLLDEAEQDPTVKVLVLRGADEEAFCAGADISEFMEYRFDDKAAADYDGISHRAFQQLANFTKPTIALIQGICIGAGVALASACDFRFTADNGRFGITASKIGLVYSLPLTELLVNLVGPVHAKDLLMTGRLLEADEAYRIGLVDRVCTREEIEARTYEYAGLITQRAQYTVRAAKKFVHALIRDGADPGELERIMEQSYNSEDYKEGVKAFLEKRKPQFTYS